MEAELAVIDRQVRHMTRLLDDLMDISRIVEGKIQLNHERLDLHDVIAKAIEIPPVAIACGPFPAEVR